MASLASARAPLALLVLSVASQVSLADGSSEHDLAPSGQQLRGAKASKQQWSFVNPDPDLLVWDKKDNFTWNNTKDVMNVSIWDGWLKVPLVHDPALMEYEMPPFVCLRVRGMPAIQQPAKNGPLLVHCGGPGSGRSCGVGVSLNDFDIDGQRSISSDFDVFSIDQRGVNISRGGKAPSCPFKQAGKAVKPFPTMYCNEMKKLMGRPKQLMKMLAPDSNSSTYVQPIWKAREIPFTDMAPYNESFIRWYYRMIKLEHSLCYQAERYQLKAPNGRNYNALLFGGTIDLAHDLNLFRRAIGAEQLSLYGYSYGTSVASVYASIFPSKTYRLVMDGEVNPSPDVTTRADSFTRGIESVWDGLVKDCEISLVRNISQDEICPAAPATATKTMKVLEGPNKSQAAILLQLIHNSVFNNSEFDYFRPGTMACVQQFYSGKQVVGCNETLSLLERELSGGANQTEAEESDHFRIGIQAMVMGTDTAGRLNEEEVITWWKQTKEIDPIGVTWATLWTVLMSTWPAYSRPVPPVGDPNLRPVIIGNLHDPQTAYENAQKTKKVFPEGYLVTWQGYGHCLEISKGATALLKEYNAAKQNNTLPAYTNAVAQYACMSKILSFLDTGKGIEDGHTCLLPEPVPLGMAAIPASVMAG